ncbi:tetratricopeptide repeat protein [Hymenobacter sp. APR13]|uniref:tetratricopeptide repeat protein n=1 Tax=Hymenobacter sp. APR13 TaxID=1356852 RepID=UPI0004E04BC3|nr:tetratricopeptide repeat protein [Hymenobacter sp. APR13]AII50582.1 hypothetical protein N008_01110 [Hymenobacter sp. APR13]
MSNRYTRLLLTLGLSLSSQFASAQTSSQDLVKQGVELHDQGKYEAAIAKYQQALVVQPNNITAKAELALTFNQIGKYKEAVELCREALDTPGNKGPNLYATCANSLDALEKPAEAEQVYKEGLKEFPGNFLLLYNLGVTQQSMNKPADALMSYQQAIVANPYHANSNGAWADAMVTEGKRIPAVLANVAFLMLEPNSKRSYEHLTMLHKLMSSGVKKTDNGGTIITVEVDPKDAKHKGSQKQKNAKQNAATQELMLSMLSTMNNLPPELSSNPVETFSFQFQLFCQSLKKGKDVPQGFAYQHYAPFFNALQDAGHTTTLAYLIHLSDDEKPYVREWLQQHEKEMQSLVSFMRAYKWRD